MTVPGGSSGTPDGAAPYVVAAKSLARPYTLTGGRTRPAHHLNMITIVKSTGGAEATGLKPAHAAVLELCRDAVAVAEIAGWLRQPLFVIKVLIADLMNQGAVTTRAPDSPSGPLDGRPDGGPADVYPAAVVNRDVLEKVLDGLQRF
jgi:hypothetical protein